MVELSITRKRICDVIFKYPGIHFRGIQRKTNLAVGCLKYNLDMLEKSRAIVSEKCGRNLRYYPPSVNGDNRRLLGILRLKSNRRILVYLLAHPSARFAELAEELNIAGSTLSWHLRRLEQEGVVSSARNGNESVYSVINEAEIKKLLTSYKESFLDGWVDGFISLWEP
jgi:predicted transcriptional regulator